jgi:UDP-N-acetylmuramoyl-tripeptide--D-alanyl-D-alanine ligase
MNVRMQKLYQIFRKNPFISTDSRNIKPGCIFFALKGETFDGNRFVNAALENGASFVVADDPAILPNHRIIKTGNTLAALQQLAVMHREHLSIPVIGITGSNGKTTTKELIKSVLSEKFKTFATSGNLNNHIGVPLSLLSINESHQMAVVEMGANHRGEIATLCDISNPDYGIITNIGKAHLEGFGSLRGVIKAKTELYSHIRRHNGKLFVNADDPLLRKESIGIPAIWYGNSEEAIISGTITKTFPFLSIDLKFDGEIRHVSSKLVGSYNFDNLLAAACIGLYFGIEPGSIVRGLESYKPANNRSEWCETDRNKMVLDAYNANPSSMKPAIANFAASPYKQKAVILGDMLELGDVAIEEHQNIIRFLSGQKFDKIILIGKNFAALAKSHPEIISFEDVQSARPEIEKMQLQGYTFLIKGSRGIRLEQLMGVL